MRTFVLMVQFLTLVTVVYGQTTAGDCCSSLQDVWVNEQNTEMNLKCVATGLLAGAYGGTVGNTTVYFQMYGSHTVGTAGSTCIVAWTVAYNDRLHGNLRSVAAWSGIYYYADDKIYTERVLTHDSTRQNFWKSSVVTQEEFTRKTPRDHVVVG